MGQLPAAKSGLAFAIAGATLFALRPVLVKLIYRFDVDPTTVMLWRMLFALPFFVVILVVINRRSESDRGEFRTIVSACCVGVLGYYFAALFDLFGLQYVSAQLGRMILYTYPTMVTLLGWWLFSDRVSVTTWLALGVSYLGIGFIYLHDRVLYGDEVLTGVLWVLASALCFSFYLLLGKSVISRLGSIRFTCIAMISASFAIVCHSGVVLILDAAGSTQWLVPTGDALLLIFVMSIASTVVPAFLISAAIARIGSSPTSIAGSFGPAMTAVFAVALLGERFTVYHLVGMLLVVGAVALSGKRNA